MDLTGRSSRQAPLRSFCSTLQPIVADGCAWSVPLQPQKRRALGQQDLGRGLAHGLFSSLITLLEINAKITKKVSSTTCNGCEI